jgi:hypothetical protein
MQKALLVLVHDTEVRPSPDTMADGDDHVDPL